MTKEQTNDSAPTETPAPSPGDFDQQQTAAAAAVIEGEDLLTCLGDVDELLDLFGSKTLNDEELAALAQPADDDDAVDGADDEGQVPPAEDTFCSEQVVQHRPQVAAVAEQERQSQEEEQVEQSPSASPRQRGRSSSPPLGEERPKKRRSFGTLQEEISNMTLIVDGDCSDDDSDDDSDDEDYVVASPPLQTCRSLPSSPQPCERRSVRHETQRRVSSGAAQQDDFQAQYRQMLDKLARTMQRSEESRYSLNACPTTMPPQPQHHQLSPMMGFHHHHPPPSPLQQYGATVPNFQMQYNHFIGRLAETMQRSEESRSYVDQQAESDDNLRRGSGMFGSYMSPMGRLM